MKKFSISRINTEVGIFRLVGQFSNIKPNLVIIFHQVEFMSTDGWRELDINSPQGKDILNSIEVEIAAHLIE